MQKVCEEEEEEAGAGAAGDGGGAAEAAVGSGGAIAAPSIMVGSQCPHLQVLPLALAKILVSEEFDSTVRVCTFD